MGIKNPRRVAFVFDERGLKPLTETEASGLPLGPDGRPLILVRPSQEALYAARRRLAAYNRCPCCYREIPGEWRT